MVLRREATADPGLSVARVLQSSEPSWLELTPGIAAYEPDQGGESRISGGGPSIARTRLLVYADAQWATNPFLALVAGGFVWLRRRRR